jgi:hypothetical protein
VLECVTDFNVGEFFKITANMIHFEEVS